MSLAKTKGVDLDFDIPFEPVMIDGDKNHLATAISNVLDNAVKYTDKGSIKLTAIKNQDSVLISVTDTGIGVSQKNIGRVFERFYQEHVEKEGVGIGLSITKQIVEYHGGRVWAESPGVGKGMTVRIELPLPRRESSTEELE